VRPVDTIRFLPMSDEGEDGYTQERKAWLKRTCTRYPARPMTEKEQALCNFTAGGIIGKDFPLRMPSSKKQGGSYSDSQQNPGCG